MASGRTLTVSLAANTNSFRRGMMSAVRDAQGFQGKMTALGANLKGMVGPAFGIAGAAIGAFAIKLGVDAVQAAIKEEQSVAQLKTALDNLSLGFAMPTVEDFIDRTQRATAVTDDQLRPAFSKLAQATSSVYDAQKLLNVALDVSAGTGRDLESVTTALARAANGQTTSLKRLAPSINGAVLKTGDLTKITGELSRLFGGAAAAKANTFAGTMERLQIAADELLESLGKGFLDAFQQGLGGTEDFMDTLKDLEPEMRTIGETVGMLAGSIASMSGAIQLAGGYLTSWVQTNLGPLQMLADVLGLGADNVDVFSDKGRRMADQLSGTVSSGIQQATDDMGNLSTETEEAAMQFENLSTALERTNAVMGYQKALDALQDSLKENGKKISIFTDKGRTNADALLAVAEAAKSAMETTDSQAQKALYASGALDTLTTTMANTKMDEGTKAALLAPFQALLDDLEENGVNVDSLQRKLDALNSKTVTVTTKFVTLGDGSYFGSGDAAGGGGSGGSGGGGGGGGRTRTRSASPVSVGTLIVNSAPGERAEESVPRSLRRLAFVAGLGV